jgi:hypothetical protein
MWHRFVEDDLFQTYFLIVCRTCYSFCALIVSDLVSDFASHVLFVVLRLHAVPAGSAQSIVVLVLILNTIDTDNKYY